MASRKGFPRIQAILTPETENRLRQYLRKRGDLSRIIEEALKMWLDGQAKT